MTSIRFLIYCDEIHVKSALKSGLCGRRSDKVCLLQSFGKIRLLPKFKKFDEMSHRESECMEVLFKHTQATETPMVQGVKEYNSKVYWGKQMTKILHENYLMRKITA